MLVMKFGGTSLASAESMGRVAAIVFEHRQRRPVVVASAMAGVTDALLWLAAAAAGGNRQMCESRLRMLRRRHQLAAARISPQSGWQQLQRTLGDLEDAVEDLRRVGEASAAWYDRIASFGELLAVILLVGALEAAGVAAVACLEPVIVTDERFGAAAPDLPATAAAGEGLRRHSDEAVLVMPGFIGRTPDGRITTLGRGGSDYSATLLAAALGSEACWIYTDVDGVFSADPRLVPDAVLLEHISTATAGRLSSCGARVLHPRSVAPAARHGFELRVRNTFAPARPGTLIQSALEYETRGATRGQVQVVVGRGNLSAVGLSGPGLAEVPQAFGRLCQAVGECGADIIQSAHPVVGHDLVVLVDAAHAGAIASRLAVEFAREQRLGLVNAALQGELALVSLIGDDLPAAVLAQTQELLAAERVESRHQMASPEVLSFLIPETMLPRAVSRIHRELVRRPPPVLAQGRVSASVECGGTEEKSDL